MMGRSMLHAAVLALIVWVGGACHASFADTATGKRVALVIGNGAYASIPRLPNPVNDALLIAKSLKTAGFTLIGGGAQTDLDRTKFNAAVQQFGQSISDADVALFYYSGHGLQINGTNYLVPISANPTTRKDLDFQMVSADLVLSQMSGSNTKLNIVILDACRNNPFPRSIRAAGSGLAEMKVPEGTLISYATQPGNVALDGDGKDSPFTTALADAMRDPGVELLKLFNRVGLAVKKSTGGQQQPWVAASPIEGDFFFVAPPKGQPSGTAQAASGAKVAMATSPQAGTLIVPESAKPRTAAVPPKDMLGVPPPPKGQSIMHLTSEAANAGVTPNAAAAADAGQDATADATAAPADAPAPETPAAETPRVKSIDPLAEALKTHHLADSAAGEAFRCPREGYSTTQNGQRYVWHGSDGDSDFICHVSVGGQDHRLAMMFYDLRKYEFRESLAESLYPILDSSDYTDSVQLTVPVNGLASSSYANHQWKKLRHSNMDINGSEVITTLLEVYVRRPQVRGIWHLWYEPHSGLLLRGTFELLEGLREYEPDDWRVTAVSLH